MMVALEYIKQTRDYLNYLQEHILSVQTSWEIVKDKCKDMRFVYDDFVYNVIKDHIEHHDVSKFSAEEFVQYREHFFPTEEEAKRNSISDVVASRERFDSAWAHHKKYNPHHWQNWTTTKYDNPYSEEIHCVCMVVDWMAMGMKFGDNARQYYEKNKDKINLPDWAIKFIYEIFDRVYGKE